MATSRSASRFRELVIGAALAFGAACADPKGNDPNVPDLAGTDASAVASCPKKALPASCPPGASPSYANDIAPIMRRSCLQCHIQGGQSADRPLDTWAHVKKLSSTLFLQIDGCLMPPADAGADAALSFQDRTEILQWLVCGSPDN